MRGTRIRTAAELVRLCKVGGKLGGSSTDIHRILLQREATQALVRELLPEELEAAADEKSGPPADDGVSLGRRLCDHYEALQGLAQRRKRGVFYTPARVVDITASFALATQRYDANEPAVSVLDPSCGGGAFLLVAAQRVGVDQVHGVDLDPIAIAVAKAALWLDFSEPGEDLAGISGRLVPGDALRGRPGWEGSPDLPSTLHWDTTFPAVWGAGGFSVVLGNPPYHALRSDDPAFRQANGLYEALFDGGRPNAFGLFLRRSLMLARPGGRVALVLPRSLARVRSYAPLRRLMDRTAQVEHLIDVGRATSGVGYEQLVVILRRASEATPRGDTRTWLLPRGSSRAKPLLTAPQAEIVQAGAIPLGLDNEGLKLVRRLESAGPALAEVAQIFRGLPFSVRNSGYSDVARSGAVPILRGCDVWRYKVRGYGYWLDNPATTRLHARLRERLGVPKIVLPNIVSSRIRANAAYDLKGLMAMDTVTAVIPKPGRAKAELILMLLNSFLGTFLLREAIFCRALLTNHMDAAYLGRFPLPGEGSQSTAACQELLALSAQRRPGAAAADQEIDALVARAYALTAEETRLISRSQTADGR